MGKKLYVGGLDYGVTDSALDQMFSPFGIVESARLIVDRDTRRSRGFGFVEMQTDEAAQTAIAVLGGQQSSGGRTLTVNEANPREERGGSRGGAGGSRRLRWRAALLTQTAGAPAGSPGRGTSGSANPTRRALPPCRFKQGEP